MKVAIIQSRKNFWGLLTKWFTGCRAYHVVFYNERTGLAFDMSFEGRRMYKWYEFYNRHKMEVEFFPCRVNEHYLVQKLDENQELYGYLDYILFFFRWLGFKVKNRKGIICSEMVNNDLRKFNVKTPWKRTDPPPSPCDLLAWYKNERNTT